MHTNNQSDDLSEDTDDNIPLSSLKFIANPQHDKDQASKRFFVTGGLTDPKIKRTIRKVTKAKRSNHPCTI
jgi:hypothetical protein